jgi:hypothetical protein
VCKLPLACLNASMYCASCHADFLQHLAAPSARQTSSGKQACELCGRQLGKVKHHRPHGPGRACTPRCKQPQQTVKSEAASATAVAPPVTTRKRRATSDPGESPEPAAPSALTRRIAAPKPAATSRKQHNTRQEEHIMRLLDETHARRMAAEAAATHLWC